MTNLSRFEYSEETGKTSVSGEDCEICLLKKEKEKRFIPQTKTKSGSEITSVTWDQAELKVTFQEYPEAEYNEFEPRLDASIFEPALNWNRFSDAVQILSIRSQFFFFN